MFKPCGALLTDFYKQDHQRQYDPSITKVVSYYVPRKTRIPEFDKVVVFGIQAFIEEYLIEYMNENFFNRPLEEVIAEYEFVISSTMGADRVNSDKIKNLHELGYLPIEIWALPEGYKVGMNIPCIEISNTNPEFAWCTNFIETLMLSELWYPMCVATAVTKYRSIVNDFYSKTSDISGRSAISEFGFRSLVGLLGEPYGFRSSNTSIIFEGSQGVLLDPDVGLSHKYTTPITCCPSPDILPSFITKDQITINFVYRSYLTRHGKGPVGDSVFKEIQNPYETNRNNLFQGEFWTYEFNEELVLYGINHVQSKFKGWYPTRAIETCCDICEGHTLATLCSYSVKTYKHNFSSICK